MACGHRRSDRPDVAGCAVKYAEVVLGVAILLLAAFGVLSYVQAKERAAEVARLEARADSLEAAKDARDSVIAVLDSAYRVDAARRDTVRARADTVFRSAVDTIREALPDSLRGLVDRMVRADSVEDAAYEADIRDLRLRIEARDHSLAVRDSLLAVKDTIITKLKEPAPLTIRLPLGLEASPGVGIGLNTDGRLGLTAGVVVR